MGNFCSQCSDGGEKKKAGALLSADAAILSDINGNNNMSNNNNNSGNDYHGRDPADGPLHHANANANNTNNHHDTADRQELLERYRVEQELLERQRAIIREEQSRLERIVSTAGREMVAIARRDGYYDPGHAARMAADLQRRPLPKLDDRSWLGGRLPPSAAAEERAVLTELSDVRTGSGDDDGNDDDDGGGSGRRKGTEFWGSHGNGGEVVVTDGDDNNNGHRFLFDDCAESFLGYLLPTKERLCQGTGQVVENLP